MAKPSWLVFVLIAALVLPWCRVTCCAAPSVAEFHRGGIHVHAHADADDVANGAGIAHADRHHQPFSYGLECDDDQQSISATPYSSLDTFAKQLPLWVAVAAAFVFLALQLHSDPRAVFRTRSPFNLPLRRHLLFCNIRD